MSKRVSVVVSAWNVREWVGETLRSVIDQTFPNDQFEIILVDDGSTDGTAEVAEKDLSRGGVKYDILRHDETRGPGAARNTGWQHATGEWIQFLDADDLLEPDKVATQMAAAEQLGTDTAAVFSPWGRLVFEDSEWTRKRQPVNFSASEDPLLDLLRPDNSFHQTGCQIFKRSWLEQVSGYDERLRLLEDVDLLMRVIMAGGALHCAPTNRPLFWYRKRRGSLSHGNHRAFVDACVRNCRLAENYWQENGTLTHARAVGLVQSYFSVARFLAEYDSPSFEPTVAHIYELLPSFVPPEPAALRRLARILGYRRAERVSIHYRRVKRLLNKRRAV